MKKIIELANEVCNDLESQDGIWLDSAIMLRDAINVRKKLEQTPITEDWLKEHGWENDYSVDECVADYTYVTFQGYIKKGDHYLLDWCNGVLKMVNDFNGAEFTKYDATVADLLDACELCGIKMED